MSEQGANMDPHYVCLSTECYRPPTKSDVSIDNLWLCGHRFSFNIEIHSPIVFTSTPMIGQVGFAAATLSSAEDRRLRGGVR